MKSRIALLLTKIFVLVGVAVLAIPQSSVGRGAGHGGGGHFGGGHFGGFHGGRLPSASSHVGSFSFGPALHSAFGGSQTRGFAERNTARAGGRLPVSRQAAQRQSESSSRTRLASHNSGSQLPSLSRAESTARSSTTDRNGRTIDSAINSHPDTAAKAAEWSRDRSPQWHQAVNDRRDYWNRWGNENDRRVQQFGADRAQQWSRIDNFWRGRNVSQTYNSRDWRDYSDRMAAFRDGRRMEIWNDARYYHDDLFDDRWWAGCGWWPGPFIGGFWDPWWWWGTCSWDTMTTFLEWGWSQTVTYDYDVNVVDEGDTVYFNGEPEASTTQYQQEAVELANPQNPSPPPAPNQGWTPFGVWALCQEEEGNADMFVQLSVNKTGQISGAYTNVLSGEKEPVTGQIDRATQRVAFRLGKNTDSVIEAGAYNLTQDVASCEVYFGKDKPQTWLLVRLPAPKMPNVPTPVAVKSTPAQTGTPGTTTSTAGIQN
jgi:hypothetical protein